ncbi:uncharacterized protein LOC115807053 [Chanos chanos]|uniref:Uncharacterized protein LOC115807053 n=1 Tax=Chanos chanos TaxID=29144 RepID=A0A6J2UXG6_CHACN|nr:uncharacterized protein LOC115807053 [Chanos chanos]
MEDETDVDTLGEQLYELILPKHPDIAGKLTGMLLELPGPVLVQMLKNEALLNEALERALTALQRSTGNGNFTSPDNDVASASSDSIGERLYDLIDLYDTGHTQKITGMLLEQKKEAVLQLLSDPALLEKKVKLAMETLKQQGEEETDVSENSDKDEAEVIGETLFARVQQIDSAHCSDITGMLLEMDSDTLRQLLDDRAMLEVAVQRAKSALEDLSNQTCSETSH